MDGGGDGKNATISIGYKGKLNTLYSTNIGNIGRMYRYVTLMLGMKPTEHEFKVMGLAGYYLPGKDTDQICKIFDETLDVKNAKFYYKKKPKDNFFYFREKLKNYRFDAISFGIQNFTEKILKKWFLQINKKYKINEFVFSGGVAQNIKATKKILDTNKIKDIFVPPGPGDESLCIGAVYAYLSTRNLKNFNKPTNIQNPYISFSCEKYDLSFINKNKKLKIRKVKPFEVAKIISNGDPVARFSLNKSEFGPRALGNRSILADPRKMMIINTINKKVKVRDFWMPFAPSILENDQKKFFKIKKNINTKFMTHSVDTTDYGQANLPSAIHPFDKTARPQTVNKKSNYEYFQLISEFKKITGIGCILNTSFNIHGEPIVNNPKDAIKSFLNCGLEFLYIGEYLVTKKK